MANSKEEPTNRGTIKRILTDGLELSVISSNITPMFYLIGPFRHITEIERGGLSEEEIVERYAREHYGYRPFNRLEATLAINGSDGLFTEELIQDRRAPGIVWFDGVVKTLEDIAQNPNASHIVKRMREKGMKRSIIIERNIRRIDNDMSDSTFYAFRFGPYDTVLSPGHKTPIKER